MAPGRFMPRGKHGTTRRFRDHGEAMRWSLGSLTRWWMKLLPAGILGIFIHFAVSFFFVNEPLDTTMLAALLALVFVVLPLAIWLVVAPLVYLCVVLAGGVMDRSERNR